MLLQGALPPDLELLLQILVEAADGAGDFRPHPSAFGRLLPRMSGAHSGYEHVRESLGHLRLIATISLKDLRMELALAVSRYVQRLNATRRRTQVAGVVPIAIALPLGAALSPSDADQRVELLAHHPFQYHANSPTSQFA
ncbi:MAG TPA: hypothetical protein VF043_23180 [Ktedonobacteraceae bacterium]